MNMDNESQEKPEEVNDMKKITINENQKGFLFRNGRFVKLLNAGKYTLYGDREVEVVSLREPIISARCELPTLLANPEIARQASVIEVADQQLALHIVDGNYENILPKGRYAFWSVTNRHEFQLVDISTPEVSVDIPQHLIARLPSSICIKVEVAPYQKARLYFDQKLIRILDAGVYYFWKNNVQVDVSLVDTRLIKMEITGQEILTQDKVSLRINFVCNYRITDYVRTLTEIDDYTEQIHIAAQLAMRDYVGKQRLDDILESKDEMSKYVFSRLKAKEKDFYVEITDAGVKDIILPGEIRSIMNTVLVAEKRAQANVITRREEVASTRSLLNTAKLMEENQTLYKLKELEFVEHICEKVGNINLNGNGDVLSQLMRLLHTETAS
jgi:regulator of protease activity HflC (stomatin/prohibitin superfamily)